MNFPNMRIETKFGIPAADQIIYNNHYILGYSYYFRQAKWALEIINQKNLHLTRLDNFRPDYRIPKIFRTDIVDYVGSGYDRGHLIASANKVETILQNSETFLLSNMSPQAPKFNRGIWKALEIKVRELNKKADVLSTYVICGPIFYFDKPVKLIGNNDSNDVSIPVPNAYFKSILTENKNGSLNMWSFLLENKELNKSIEKFLVSTTLIEKLAGIKLWEELRGKKIKKEKSKIRKIW